MDSKAYIQGLIDKARAAQAVVDHYTQEQVDKLAKAIGKAVFDSAEILSKEAVEETKYGIYESKYSKHRSMPATTWAYMQGQPSVGVIARRPELGIVEYAKPMGVICALQPVTNPTTTATTNAMNAIKCRNAIIVAPHPAAKKCTAHVVKIMNDTIVALGGPENLVQTIEEPTLELSNLLMQMSDVVLATGGPSMVKAAYSSGRPSMGVGQGNTQVLIAPDYTDFDKIAENVIFSRSYDNGVPCMGEQTLHVPASKIDAIMAKFVEQGAYEVKGADLEKAKANVFTEKGPINPKIVGKLAHQVAEVFGIEGCPDNAKLLIAKVDNFGKGYALAREILCPFVRFLPYDDNNFKEAIERARTNFLVEGAGHTAGIYSNKEDFISATGERIPTCRIMVNQPTLFSSGSPFNNGLAPTSSVGCGSWGGNSLSENVSFKHFYNITRVSYIIPGVEAPTFDEIWERD